MARSVIWETTDATGFALQKASSVQTFASYLRTAGHAQRVEASAVKGDGSDGPLGQAGAVGHIDHFQISDVLAHHLTRGEQKRREDMLGTGTYKCRCCLHFTLG